MNVRGEKRCHSIAFVQESSVEAGEEKRCHLIAVVQAAPIPLGWPRRCTEFVRTGAVVAKCLGLGKCVNQVTVPFM